MFLLDTNVVSELRLLERANPSVADWSRSHKGDGFFLSVATIQEVQYGILRLRRRDKPQGDMLGRWLAEHILPDFAGRILPLTVEIALACAALRVPNRRGERDAWIAATALVHDMTVVTRNTRDFAGTGVKLLDPWAQP